MGAVKNHYHDDICREAYFRELGPWESSDCEACDGFGCCWNNADPTCGQYAECEECGDTRGHK